MSEETNIEKLASILDRLERRNDAPVLERIEENTSVLPELVSSLDFNLKQSVEQAKSIKAASTRADHTVATSASEQTQFATVPATIATPKPATVVMPTVEPDAPERAPQVQKTATAEAVRVVPQKSDAPAPQSVPKVKNPVPTADATRIPTPLRESPERDPNGRFVSKDAMAEVRQGREGEKQAKGIIDALTANLKPTIVTRRGDAETVESAAGKAAGGPLWEAGKELAEAAGEIRENIHDEKTIAGRVWKSLGRRFHGKGKDQATLAMEKGEKAEQKRHRELVQAIENNQGGGNGDGGALDKIDDALDIFGSLKKGKRSPLSKLPGGGAKGAGIGGLLTNPVALLGSLAALSVGSALKSLILGGSNPINDVFEWGKQKVGLGGDSTAGYESGHGKSPQQAAATISSGRGDAGGKS